MESLRRASSFPGNGFDSKDYNVGNAACMEKIFTSCFLLHIFLLLGSFFMFLSLLAGCAFGFITSVDTNESYFGGSNAMGGNHMESLTCNFIHYDLFIPYV